MHPSASEDADSSADAVQRGGRILKCARRHLRMPTPRLKSASEDADSSFVGDMTRCNMCKVSKMGNYL
jgi:hypothetical protein